MVEGIAATMTERFVPIGPACIVLTPVHYNWTMTDSLELFACIAVSDHGRAVPWYEALLGPVTFEAHPTESVWELAEHRSIAVNEEPEHAGHARVTVFVDDLDAVVAAIAERGLEPAERETYGNGVRKTTFRDPDGNEIGFGGAPLEA